MKHIFVLAGFVIVICMSPTSEGLAYNWHYDLVATHYPLTERTQSCLVCHTPAGAQKVNPYGRAFQAAGSGVDALDTIAEMDSDDDGVSNDHELRTGHFPGDPGDVSTDAELKALAAGKSSQVDLYRELNESLQCPCCDKMVMHCECTMIPEIQRIVREGVAEGKGAARIKGELVARYGRNILPLRERKETVPPPRFTFPVVANAYRIASEIPRELEKYPCFCSCYRMNGHATLLDCYKNAHAARCKICMDEAEMIEVMVQAKRPDPEIRARLLARFAGRR
jgi:hypothetical protein